MSNAKSINQLNSNFPMFTRNAFFASLYATVEETLSILSDILIALTITTAADHVYDGLPRNGYCGACTCKSTNPGITN